MFQLILGRSGTGKSRYILDNAAKMVRDGGKVMLIVPEQFSFETERKMLAVLTGKSSLDVSVLSFSRLCENIFRQYGGLAGKRLTDMARLVLMKLAVQESADSLELYSRQCKRTDFLETMLETIDELKSSGTDPRQLRDTLLSLEDSQLKAKLSDITAIYEVYQGIVERDYQDPLDDISRAVKLVRGNRFFKDYHLYIDGFSFFSPPERSLMEVMLEQSESITVALTADGLHESGPLDIFCDQKKTAHWFIQRCGVAGVICKKPIILEVNRRAATSALRCVEEFMALGQCEAGDSTGLAVVHADDKYDEVRYAAAEITRLVRECGYRYRDIAVVCRSLQDYETALETIFAAYNIPLFFDKKEQVTSRPVMVIVTAALDAVRGEWKTEAILRIARCPASGISMEESAALENYLYIWSINGKAWEKSFVGAPSGLNRTVTDDDRKALAVLEGLRDRLITPLIRLKKRLKNCTGNSFSLGIYDYLCDVRAVENLREYDNTLCDDSEAEETDTLYNTLMDILDLFSDTMGDIGFPAATFIEMFELALGCVELGHIPNTNDQTIAGSADRVRLDSPKAVFAIGVNEGIFPANYQPYGVFSDNEREQLVQYGVEISASRFQRALLERYFLYSTLCAPSEKLYICCATATLSGVKQEPSLIVSQLSEFMPETVITASALPYGNYVTDLFTAREQYVRMRGAGLASADLAAAMTEEGDSGFLQLMDRLSADLPAEGIRRETSAEFFMGKLNLSPTRIESYYRCPYMYFCDSMLKLKKRKRVEYTPLESGSAVHYVLEHLLGEMDGREINQLQESELEQKLSTLLQGYIESVTEDSTPLASRFKYQFKRLVSVLILLVRHIGEDFEQSLFTTAGVEVTVGNDGAVKPLSFTTNDSTNITVNGKIDRVDIYTDGADRYARVVDYKSGGKEFRLEEVFYGLNMQMLIYLFSLCEDKSGPFGEVKPAGILYMSGKVSPAEVPPGADRALLRSLIDDTLQMKGLLLEDERVLRAMERELAGRYIPASVTKSGELTSKSKVKSMQEFKRIECAVRDRVKEMGEALTEGQIEPMPAHGKGLNPCDYCDYGILCANKNTRRFRDVTGAAKEADAEEE